MSTHSHPSDAETVVEDLSDSPVSENSSHDDYVASETSSSTSETELDEEDYREGGAELSWQGVKVNSSDGSNVLLHPTVGKVQGRLLALMGPSGAGKTTFLNLLAGRLSGTKGSGFRMIDGHKYGKNDLKKLTGYVMQDDILFPYLTVQETLEYAAFLRMPSQMPKSEKLARMDQLIEKLGLERNRNTPVGDSIKKGLSGGERKRLSVALELLTNPKILFLDEPTSGLDSVTAYTLMGLLKDLARSEKCTVICTIHQPSTKIFNLFDDLMVLKSGYVVYHGPVNKVLDYYDEAGFPCPLRSNPADHVLDVITPQNFTPEGIKMAEDNAQQLASLHVTDEEILQKPKKGKLPLTSVKRASWLMQLLYLTQRAYRNSFRAKLEFIAQFIQTIMMAVLIGGVYFQLGNDQASARKKLASLFFIVINQGFFASLILINSFPSERIIVLRERASGMYSVSSYYISKTIAEVSLQFIFPLLLGAIVYFMIDYQHDAGKFFIFLVFVELGAITATSMALAIATISRTVGLAITFLPFLLEVCRLFGGYYLAPALLPVYFSWIDALSFVKYDYIALAMNELTGAEFYCTPAQLQTNSKNETFCPLATGEDLIADLGLDKDIQIWGCALVLLSMIIFYRVVGYLALRYEILWSYLSWGNVVLLSKRIKRKLSSRSNRLSAGIDS